MAGAGAGALAVATADDGAQSYTHAMICNSYNDNHRRVNTTV